MSEKSVIETIAIVACGGAAVTFLVMLLTKKPVSSPVTPQVPAQPQQTTLDATYGGIVGLAPGQIGLVGIVQQ
jgi:hypothetical protein